MRNTIYFVLIFTFLFIFSACSSTQTLPETATAGNDLQRMESIYWERVQQSRMHFTEDDVDFMTHMVGHHAQALVISQFAPKNNASQIIQTLAARIINAQKDEIATMQRWLRFRNQPVPEVEIDGVTLAITGVSSTHGVHRNEMPGMLTQQEIDHLNSLQGREFDRMYLTYMIKHHEGAVVMVEELFAIDGAAQDEDVFRLASDIQVDQITEIDRMKLMLSEMEES